MPKNVRNIFGHASEGHKCIYTELSVFDLAFTCIIRKSKAKSFLDISALGLLLYYVSLNLIFLWLTPT